MVVVTPGVDYLAKGLVFLAGYGIFTSTSVSYLAARAGYDIPRWMVLAAFTASVPLLSTIYVIGQKISRWRRSYTVGARIVPEVQGTYPGNLDVSPYPDQEPRGWVPRYVSAIYLSTHMLSDTFRRRS